MCVNARLIMCVFVCSHCCLTLSIVCSVAMDRRIQEKEVSFGRMETTRSMGEV